MSDVEQEASLTESRIQNETMEQSHINVTVRKTKSPATELKLLTVKRTRIMNKIESTVKSLSSTPSEFLIKDLRDDFKVFESLQDSITEIALLSDAIDENYDLVSEKYCELYSQFTSKCRKETAETVHHSTSKSHINLPQIKLCKFNGEIVHWIEFKNMFDAIIHQNTSLSDIEKFHYLKAHVCDSAAQMIANLSLSNENYQIAYTQLCERYSNPRRLCSYYIDQLLDFKPLIKSDYPSLKAFTDIHSNCVSALKAQKLPDLSDFILLSLCLKHLDTRTRLDFENKSIDNIPTYQDLMKLLVSKTRTHELVNSSATVSTAKNESKPTATHSNENKSNKRFSLVASNRPQSPNCVKSLKSKPQCIVCGSMDHSVYACQQFVNLSIDERYNLIKQKGLCFQCFGNHNRIKCKSQKACKICDSGKHHTLLHAEKKSFTTEHSNSVHSQKENAPTTFVCNTSSLTTSDSSACLLGTANVLVFDSFNKPHIARAVLDSASQITAVTKELVNKLNLKSSYSTRKIIGIGSKTTSTHGEVDLLISSQLQPNFRLNTKATVLPNITCNQPLVSLNSDDFDHFANLKLADEKFYVSDKIDLLIGADYFLQTLCAQSHGITKLYPNSPGALSTVFGYIIIGKFDSDEPHSRVTIATSLLTYVEPVNQLLQKFWETEEVSVKTKEDPSHMYCENLYTETTTRWPSGRYEVALPFKYPTVSLGDYRNSSMKKYASLERRLALNEDVHKQYHDFMSQYVELEHMSRALHPSNYVIPHHCIQKEDSSTTKLRVVFNASAPCNNGTVLNESLHVGPKLQNELSHILISFRTHKVAITSDIKMMYRQIAIRKQDRKFQHIFYRHSPQEELSEFELNTVTYGMTSSSFLAQRTLLQLASDYENEFPLAVNAVRQHTYVDDVVSGASNLCEAKLLISQLNELMSKGELQLRKWSSNMREAIEEFPEEMLENPLAFSDSTQKIKVLGFRWNPSSDTFSYTVTPFNEKPTKRSILSYTAKLFDPLGLLSPVVFSFKYFLKLLWLSNLEWDDPLDEDLTRQWNRISHTMMTLSNVQIPRHIDTTYVNVSLLGYCDASERGYSASFYIHVSSNEQFIGMNLIMSKTRVAPVKTHTIPRLELCGALLLAKLFKIVLPLFQKCISNVRLYSDATLVLNWLKTPAHKLKIYVSNRVTQILELTSPENWFHVQTESNPADLASRGLAAQDIVENSLWWHGHPSFHVVFEKLPISKVDKIVDDSELKPPASILTTVVLEKSHTLEYFEKRSNIHKAVRIFAYVLRFIKNCKLKKVHEHNLRSRRAAQTRITSPLLSVAECRSALLSIVKLTQHFYFCDALQLLSKGENPPQELLSLAPFIDDSGLLRVGGRLRNSCLPYDSRHPLLLPKLSHLSTLVCDQIHRDHLHVGPRTTQSLVARKYWIISARNLIKSRIHHCVRCTRMRAQPRQPIMSDLPGFRTNISSAFTHVGIDFAGPFITKCSPLKKPRMYKGYLALFICLAVKAVHLEYVSELTTESFLTAFDRFVSRRGLPAHIYSDNGLNFVGAARHLSDVTKLLSEKKNEIYSAFVKREVTWHFNPPSAPNFGGIWEANIKSAKALLKNLIGDTPMTMEEYFTIFSRIEAIMNSRPLLEPSPDPNEHTPLLTPGHFIIGRPLLQVVELPLDNSTSTRQRWTHLRQLVQSFWHRWRTEYLQTLIQRNKWKIPINPIKVGQIVLIKNLNTSPTLWPIGRIEKIFPGRDQVVRVALIRTACGNLTRPVNKLIVMPIV